MLTPDQLALRIPVFWSEETKRRMLPPATSNLTWLSMWDTWPRPFGCQGRLARRDGQTSPLEMRQFNGQEGFFFSGFEWFKILQTDVVCRWLNCGMDIYALNDQKAWKNPPGSFHKRSSLRCSKGLGVSFFSLCGSLPSDWPKIGLWCFSSKKASEQNHISRKMLF